MTNPLSRPLNLNSGAAQFWFGPGARFEPKFDLFCGHICSQNVNNIDAKLVPLFGSSMFKNWHQIGAIPVTKFCSFCGRRAVKFGYMLWPTLLPAGWAFGGTKFGTKQNFNVFSIETAICFNFDAARIGPDLVPNLELSWTRRWHQAEHQFDPGPGTKIGQLRSRIGATFGRRIVHFCNHSMRNFGSIQSSISGSDLCSARLPCGIKFWLNHGSKIEFKSGVVMFCRHRFLFL